MYGHAVDSVGVDNRVILLDYIEDRMNLIGLRFVFLINILVEKDYHTDWSVIPVDINLVYLWLIINLLSIPSCKEQ